MSDLRRTTKLPGEISGLKTFRHHVFVLVALLGCIAPWVTKRLFPVRTLDFRASVITPMATTAREELPGVSGIANCTMDSAMTGPSHPSKAAIEKREQFSKPPNLQRFPSH